MVKPMNDFFQTMVEAKSSPAIEMIEELPVGYMELDRDGAITRVNRMACKLFQMEADELVGKLAWDFMPSDEMRHNRDAYMELMLNREEPEPIQRTFYTRNGSVRIYQVYRTRILDRNALTVGMRQITLDITESYFAHEEVARARVWLESVLSSVAEAVLVTDALGFVRYANVALENLIGWKSHEITGKVIEKVLPMLSYESLDGTPFNTRRVLEKRCKVIATVLTRDRKELRVELSVAPIIEKESQGTAGVVTILRPLSYPKPAAPPTDAPTEPPKA